jgi:hypothetical protein
MKYFHKEWPGTTVPQSRSHVSQRRFIVELDQLAHCRAAFYLTEIVSLDEFGLRIDLSHFTHCVHGGFALVDQYLQISAVVSSMRMPNAVEPATTRRREKCAFSTI